jgi:hypothetical protein
MDGALMNRLELFSVLLFQSSLVFCQSTATSSASPQVPGKVSMGQWLFGFRNNPLEQSVAKPTFKSFNCASPSTNRNHATAPVDLDHLFNVACPVLKTDVETLALNERYFSRSPLVVGLHPKGEPIPTQWPNAKIVRIPTHWPNLKLQAIDGGSSDSDPARGGVK